ncbi:MAG: dihydroorotase [Bacteroidota bacterium]
MNETGNNTILINGVTLIHPGHKWHLKQIYLNLNSDGTIGFDRKYTVPITPKFYTIDGSEYCVSAGWFDMRMRVGEPGHESRETIHSACAAGAAGGFTGMACLPETSPVVQTKESVQFLAKGSDDKVSRIYPIGAVTRNLEGKELTDMLDLHNAGAVAFSDGTNPITNPDILYKTLLYLRHADALLMQRAEDPYLAKFGQMHEGNASTLLGMKGIPSLAEELMIARDLKLLAHAGGRLHFSTLSTAEGVALIRKAKAEGLKVTADVAVHQLAFTDEDLDTFDTDLKASPPFRSETDRQALLAGLADGTIDVIVSDHTPLDTESKMLEFDLASPGQASLETFYAVARKHTHGFLDEAALIEKFSLAPRRILGLPIPDFSPGSVADFTLFKPDLEFVYNRAGRQTLGVNSPFFGKVLKGLPVLTVRGNFRAFNLSLTDI